MSAILLRVLLFLLPFLLFWLLIKFVRDRRRTAAGPSDPADLAAEEAREERRAWVFIASLALIVGGVLTALLLTSRGSDDRDKVYIPPRVVDGQVVPGRFVDPEEAAQETTDPPPGGQTDEHGQPDRR